MISPRKVEPVPATLLAAALDYAADGWSVLPLQPGTKVPATLHGVDDATTDPAAIRRWWFRWPTANVGVALAPSRLVVLDADRHGKVDGPATLDALVKSAGPLPAGPVVETAGNGAHYYFSRRATMEARRSIGVAHGLDLLAAGYAVLPPSVVNGRGYRWIVCPPEARALAELPRWVEQLAESRTETPSGAAADWSAIGGTGAGRYAIAALTREAVAVASCPVGQRNDALNAAAFTLATLAAGCLAAGKPCFTEAEAWAMLALACRANGLAMDRSSGGGRGCWRTFASGWRDGWDCPRHVGPPPFCCAR